jgi:hypothetical protein
MAVAFLYFVMILLSYNKADPGWSHANTVSHIANLGGKAGAWLADLLLFIFGFSAWWWGVCSCAPSGSGYRRLTRQAASSRPKPEHQDEFIVRWIGFALMFAGSVGLEYLRMWSWDVELPRAARRRAGPADRPRRPQRLRLHRRDPAAAAAVRPRLFAVLPGVLAGRGRAHRRDRRATSWTGSACASKTAKTAARAKRAAVKRDEAW